MTLRFVSLLRIDTLCSFHKSARVVRYVLVIPMSKTDNHLPGLTLAIVEQCCLLNLECYGVSSLLMIVYRSCNSFHT